VQHLPGRLLEAAEDRLTADDDELVQAGHVRSRCDDMLELLRTQT
jgi:hypothetical protein